MTTMSFDKPEWREANFRWIAKQVLLWQTSGKKKQLRYAYSEMLGESGDQMYKLFAKYNCLPAPEYFEGVDIRGEILMKHVLEEAPFTLVCDDFWRRTKVRVARGVVPLGVINIDTTNNPTEGWWEQNSYDLNYIVDAATKKCPSFVVILNNVLDRGKKGTTTEDRIRTHAGGILQTFSSAWDLTEAVLLDGADTIWTSRGFEGRAGGFEIYRSREHDLRMITTRFAFDRARRHVKVERSG